MSPTMVPIPVSLLLDPAVTATAKVLWLVMRTQTRPLSQRRLASASGLSVITVRKGLTLLEATGWHAPQTGALERLPTDASVSIPASLLVDRRVRPLAKLLYGMLQTLSGSGDRSEAPWRTAGTFSYKTLCEYAHVSSVTIKQLVGELAESGWIQVAQANQGAPVQFTLRIPDLDRNAAALAQVRRRLEESHFRGEALMREYLSLLIDADEFEDNSRPGFLTNPLTNERMELDRYYPPVLAFEYNGAQHYLPTERYPGEQALLTQQARDLMKEGLCARRGIRFIVITQADLRLETMQEKVGTLLPLRDLRGHEEVIALLDKASKQYRS